MKIPRRIIPAAILAIVLTSGYFIDRTKQRNQSVLSGSFETQPAELASRVGGRVKSLPVQEGDMVEPGQTLAVLEANPDQHDTEAAAVDLKQSEQALQEAKLNQEEQVREQQDAVDQLQAELDKDVNGSRPEDIAAARANLRSAQAKLDEALRGPRPEEIRQSKAQLAGSEVNLKKVKNGGSAEQREKLAADLATAQATETHAKITYDRQQLLFQEDAVSAQARDDAKASYTEATTKRISAEHALTDLNSRPEDVEIAQKQVDQNRQGLDLLLAGTRKEDIDAARAVRDQADANLRLLLAGTRREDLEEARAKLAQAKETLVALRDGSRNQTVAQAQSKVRESEAKFLSSHDKSRDNVIQPVKRAKVERVLVALGDLVSPGTSVVRVSYPDDLHIRIYVPERDLSHIQPGEHASLEVDGIVGRVDCIVESASSEGEFTPANLQTPEERGKQVFTVRLRPATPNPALKAGMSATVRQLGDWTP